MERKRSIKNEMDFLLSQALLEVEIAKEVLDSIRNKKNKSESEKYYEEKVALKMLDFLEEEERMIKIYVEAKTNYPILADMMENKRPYLKKLLEEAKRLYEKSLLEK